MNQGLSLRRSRAKSATSFVFVPAIESVLQFGSDDVAWLWHRSICHRGELVNRSPQRLGETVSAARIGRQLQRIFFFDNRSGRKIDKVRIGVAKKLALPRLDHASLPVGGDRSTHDAELGSPLLLDQAERPPKVITRAMR